MSFLIEAATSYALAQALFLRLLGLIYLLAFLSLLVQVRGLYCSRGLSPIAEQIRAIEGRIPGALRYAIYPSLFWFCCRDGALLTAAALGVLLSLLLMLGVFPPLMLTLLYLLYLSFTSLGQRFLAYQWDALLLETGFLAIFFSLVRPPTRLMIFGCWFFFFRFLFSAGAAKLTSGDPNWRNLTALRYHYETQPLPNRLGWWGHQMPRSFQKLSTLGTFCFEILVPFLALGPAASRLTAFGLSLFFQLLIFGTGSYGFFNLLAMVLTIPLLDNRYLRLLPESIALEAAGSSFLSFACTAIFCIFLLLNLIRLIQLFSPGFGPSRLMQILGPFSISNPYGLFAVMTTQRLELVIEGSRDGLAWEPYEFKWKPGDPMRAPRQAAPHQPRLDWQMWFAALNPQALEPWLVNLLYRLLEGDKVISGFFSKNPFREKPPEYVRILVYRYRFTDVKTKRETGQWWSRELLGRYPPLRRDSGDSGSGLLIS